MSVLQLNLHKSKTASAELLLALEEVSAYAALVQEPWIASGNTVAGLKSLNYDLYVPTLVSRSRTAILVKKGLKAHLLPNYSNDDLTVVVLESREGCLLLASCYMAHDMPAPPDELRRLVDMVCSSNKHLIIGTDSNAHHSVWGSPDINDRAPMMGSKHRLLLGCPYYRLARWYFDSQKHQVSRTEGATELVAQNLTWT
ncbi:uncharacterized protein LOC127565228 [Drosophila albomicans]|uniref:Uncharacterized protein LOC127565228 n=1 Tax=Drosophila albomicans TaxID=7291 RepID=A0A9C6SZJ4_DROAB|nr:uncharacterized protein LOC127565228 [Drosophila albomicans]